jgi:3-oxoacyl-[acyl-carrier-protein] synthase II
VYFGSGIGGLGTTSTEVEKLNTKGPRRVSSLFVPMMIPNMAAGAIAIRFGCKGAAMPSVTACASGSNAIGEAVRAIRHGYTDAAIAGGAEASIVPVGVAGFINMQALSTAEDPNAASLPFDARRGGFVIGEGAAALVLEEYEHAKARGAKIYGEMVGYGNTCDAYHPTAPRPDGTTQAKCISLALEEAGFDKEKDNLYINAHGTGTKLNDVAETVAYKIALGDFAYKAHISSIKSMTGHMFGAAGAAEAIATVLALKNGIIPPTIHLDCPDPECDLDYTPNVALKSDITLGISDSLGFGGHDACVAFRKFEEE